MTDYPITQGHIKSFRRGRGRKSKYPFKTMEVGHTFPFTLEEYDRVLWAMAQFQARDAQRKFHISRIELIVERVK